MEHMTTTDVMTPQEIRALTKEQRDAIVEQLPILTSLFTAISDLFQRDHYCMGLVQEVADILITEEATRLGYRNG